MQGIQMLDKTAIKVEAFKRGIFDFISCNGGKRHEKQEEALRVLTDNETRELLYGGAAGGAKSWTGASWLLFSALAYPGTKWFIGREELKRLRSSTLLTFYKVCKAYGIPDSEYSYNGQDNYIQFKNGSRIDMLDLRHKPSDPLYERFGSLEYTGGWVEEGGEINFGAFDVLKTRIGRHLNGEFGLTPKIFVTCNPKKNWMYSYFYKPFKEDLLKPFQKFLQAFVQDNPFIEKDYIELLQGTTDKAKRERLLKGNWEYDDNPYKLCIYDLILDIFRNTHINRGKKKYITADVARFGSDSAVIGVWHGWDLIEVHEFEISKTTEIQACIEAMQNKHRVPKRHCIVDSDGVGGGVVDNLDVIGFKNNGRPFKEKTGKGKEVPKYKNIKTQLIVYLAEKIINENMMHISAELSEKQIERIKEELDTIERIPDSDIIALVSKEQIKQDIGRSPDYLDMIFMRAYFDFKKIGTTNADSIASMI
ncbi:terminase family protein [Elizabethkingia sp. HX WHF]|uniref:Terminase family protein n=2 Tax=Elizabethkingia TaxID=308865 RepID=A0ABY3NAH6_ELIMR|nr:MULTISPECIES: phage terminase large subunit [Elizabethkingia]MCT4287358.1 phage portal protein [Elizabethkingia anophelis]MDX8564659.1 terminase family protein [Elizabethkingia sp. HX WHF]OBS12985.1 phage portal protein [Elizabethkingia miricola]TYO84201.1 terminase family protein [Elizabethkingia miricola]